MTRREFDEICSKLIFHMIRNSSSLGLSGNGSHVDAIAHEVGVDVSKLRELVAMMDEHLPEDGSAAAREVRRRR